ncbi:MAG: translation initiation factor IF-2 [Candidatus Aminicenantales bacterium]
MEKIKPKKKTKPAAKTPPSRPHYLLGEGMTLKEVAERLGIKTRDLLSRLETKGRIADVNDLIDESLVPILGQEFNCDLELVSYEQEVKTRALAEADQLVTRPPVVTIMGHVDHGKTTLLDAIRHSRLVDKEYGGITQHIGAYRVSWQNRWITFIDTPGHEAFTQLRSRGAQVTDIVVLVVAADDGVMPQTREAISHARAAGVPIIVAINKIDKPEANPVRVKQQLAQENLLVEEWGGQTICVELSAKEKKNINELLEMILLLADIIEIKANPRVEAQGIILEAKLDPKKGPSATVIVQHGVLVPGQAFISGVTYGKIRAMFDEFGRPIRRVEPSMPAEILGFSAVPVAGDYFQVVPDTISAQRIVEARLTKIKKEEPARPPILSLDELFKQVEKGEVKELNLIVKADVQGSVDVMRGLLPSFGTEEVKVKILHAATGPVTESDILLASASKAVILAYNLRVPPAIQEMARQEKVEIRNYQVIYELIDDIKKAVRGMLEPEIKEIPLGKAEVRKVFEISRVGKVAGCYVLEGKITRQAEIRILRKNEVVYQGRVASLKHLKDNVSEVKKDMECGIGLDKFQDFREGDIIIAFQLQKTKVE